MSVGHVDMIGVILLQAGDLGREMSGVHRSGSRDWDREIGIEMLTSRDYDREIGIERLGSRDCRGMFVKEGEVASN